MRRGRIALAAVLAAAALLAVLYAQDIRAWQETLRTSNVAYVAAPGHPVRTAPATTFLPAGLSADLLSVRVDREWLKALPHFVGVYGIVNPADNLGPPAYTLITGAERDLTKVTQDSDPAGASQAYDLLGVLYFRSAYPGSGTRPDLLEEAVADLQNAVRVDPANEVAKENLELAMRVLVAKHGGKLKIPGSGTQATKKRRGSDALPPGGGF
ncbi:MAG TPA: hypothetical protein VGU02_05015 [Gaiellaceae bacterium]|nr:hypothetical protein [Gaiellaceae bacterium]